MKMKGDWDEGSLQKGKWEMVNGDYYDGEFAYNKPKGAGKWHLKIGNVIAGTYNQELLPASEELDVEENVERKIKLR